jgi:hypothetical protein
MQKREHIRNGLTTGVDLDAKLGRDPVWELPADNLFKEVVPVNHSTNQKETTNITVRCKLVKERDSRSENREIYTNPSPFDTPPNIQ